MSNYPNQSLAVVSSFPDQNLGEALNCPSPSSVVGSHLNLEEASVLNWGSLSSVVG